MDHQAKDIVKDVNKTLGVWTERSAEIRAVFTVAINIYWNIWKDIIEILCTKYSLYPKEHVHFCYMKIWFNSICNATEIYFATAEV